MRCDGCNGPTRVRDTVSKSESVLRRRCCKSCGHRFTTIETIRETTQRSHQAIFGTARNSEPPTRLQEVPNDDDSDDELSGLGIDDIARIIREELGG